MLSPCAAEQGSEGSSSSGSSRLSPRSGRSRNRRRGQVHVHRRLEGRRDRVQPARPAPAGPRPHRAPRPQGLPATRRPELQLPGRRPTALQAIRNYGARSAGCSSSTSATTTPPPRTAAARAGREGREGPRGEGHRLGEPPRRRLTRTIGASTRSSPKRPAPADPVRGQLERVHARQAGLVVRERRRRLHLTSAGAVGLVRLVRRYVTLAAEGAADPASSQAAAGVSGRWKTRPATALRRPTTTVAEDEEAALTGNSPPVRPEPGRLRRRLREPRGLPRLRRRRRADALPDPRDGQAAQRDLGRLRCATARACVRLARDLRRRSRRWGGDPPCTTCTATAISAPIGGDQVDPDAVPLSADQVGAESSAPGSPRSR